MAEALVRTAIRSGDHLYAGAGAVAVLERVAVAFVLGELQFSLLRYTEHCVSGEQCGAHVRQQTVR